MEKINEKLEDRYRPKVKNPSKIPKARPRTSTLKKIDRNNLKSEPTNNNYENADDTLTDEDDTNDRVGLCVTCNLAIVESYDKNFKQRPLLCNRCIKRLDSQTDTSCTFCQSDSQNSASDYSQHSNECLYEDQPKYTTRTYNLPDTLSKTSFLNPEFPPNIYRRGPLCRTNSVYNWQDVRTSMMPKNQTSYLNILRKEANPSEMKVNFQNLECSRRPIRCPRLDCRVNVAFSALTHHFLFDHPEVPVISVDPELKSTVVFAYSSISYDSSRCLALLLVSNKLSESIERLFSSSQIHDKYRNRLPLPVLAARLRRKSLYTGSGDMESDNTYGEGDVVIIWIAGLDVGNHKNGPLQCSIQAVDNIDNESIRSLTYTGPINCLRTVQSPRQVLLNGDCLILHEGFINNVSSGNANLNVNLIVH